jgi:hypothetical protein
MQKVAAVIPIPRAIFGLPARAAAKPAAGI